MTRGIELWGGVECARIRVGAQERDQLERTGHSRRVSDLDLVAGLGIRALRYPVLWERVAPDGLASADWSWSDERLERLRALGIRPIVGLLHHGNGPRETNLLDPGFPEKFADYARAVAERYPWVDAYLPINEPLTTARFCGLYGIWFPHRSDVDSFTRILLHQVRATVLAMEAIREVNPEARLIQGEDVGTIGSTPGLAWRAAYENERRWLTFDLLCGRLDEQARMWPKLLSWGADPGELQWLLDHPSPPDVLGVDHYITSDRLLDERLERYPEWAHGGEDGGRWADVEAVRATAEEPPGVLTALREVWRRYERPVAITESHLGSTREEQLRWLQEGWDAAQTAAAEGVDVRALTVWMLFGGFDWNTLMTGESGFYEPGAFDLRGGEPRPTAIAGWMREIAGTGQASHPVLADPPWWRRPERLTYPAVEVGWRDSGPRSPARTRRPVVVLGAPGLLRDEVERLSEVRGFEALVVDPHGEANDLERTLADGAPWAIVDVASHGHAGCRECDAASLAAAELSVEAGAALVHVSSDLAYAGRSDRPYVESDAADGDEETVEREAAVEERNPDVLLVRVGPLFGPDLAPAEPTRHAGRAVSPTYVVDASQETLDLLVDGETGVWHVANRGIATWETSLEAVAARDEPASWFGTPLASERGAVLPDLRDAVRRCVAEPDHRGFPLIPGEWKELAEAEIGGGTAPAFSAPAHVPTSTRTSLPEERGS